MQDYAARVLGPDIAAYKDGGEALYVAKVMLTKMARKDWTSLGKQWITSQCKQIRAAMPAACHFGCSGVLSAAGSLGSALPLASGLSAAAESELAFDVHYCSGISAAAARGAALAAESRSGADPTILAVDFAQADSATDASCESGVLRLRLHVSDDRLRLAALHGRLEASVRQRIDTDSVAADAAELKGRLAEALCLHETEFNPEHFKCGPR